MKINAYSFITALKAVIPFAVKKDVRWYLNGVHLVYTGGGFHMEATDGYTAARVTFDCLHAQTELDIIIPLDECLKITKLKINKKERHSQDLDFVQDGYLFNVKFGGNTLVGYGIKGRFPDLSLVLPPPILTKEHYPEDRGFNAKYLARMADSAAMLASPKYHVCLLKAHSGSRDKYILEVPTSHNEFPGISKPAIFIGMPMYI